MNSAASGTALAGELFPPEAITAEGSDPIGSAPAPISSEVKGHLVTGTAMLGAGVIIERGTGFIANTLAFRLGGPGVFGAYAVALSTANNIATYAAAGIGATAARFSGKYKYESDEYPALASALLVISIVSAALAGVALYLGAVPLARLLGQPGLVPLLHLAVLSAVGAILLECARGFFVGQRRLRALLTLSLIVGVGLLVLLPLAASRHNSRGMVLSQGSLAAGAVLVCLALAKPLQLGWKGRVARPRTPVLPVIREVWSFGMVQLAGLVGTNVSGWWVTALVARGDHSFVQMGYFAIASQLRNLVGLAPGLLTEGSFAVMADPAGEQAKTPHYVLGLTTFASCFISLLLAGAGIALAPLLLRLGYKDLHASAALPVSLALALAVVHMSNAPASARLSILSIRTSGVINTLWAVVVALAGTLFMFHGGSAAKAMVIYVAAHALSSALVLWSLRRRGALPAGLTLVCALTAGSACGMAVLAALRTIYPNRATSLSLLILALLLASLGTLSLLGRHHRWAPSPEALGRLLRQAGQRLRPRRTEVTHV